MECMRKRELPLSANEVCINMSNSKWSSVRDAAQTHGVQDPPCVTKSPTKLSVIAIYLHNAGHVHWCAQAQTSLLLCPATYDLGGMCCVLCLEDEAKTGMYVTQT